MKHLSIATAVALAAFSAIAAENKIPDDPSKLPPASTKTGLTFQNDIKPMFDEACVRCHGAQKPKAGLQLNSLEGVLKGARHRKDVVPGDADKSPLVFAVANINGKVFMPPKPRGPRPGAAGSTNAPATPPPPAHPYKPLTAEQVGVVRAWIDQGAK